ncbi:MAG TPA: 30S ribosomal protein S20 [Clostridiales bacterium]|nr:30S ribosomal protein S20 [Clostridiales bacterium]
MANIKSSIKRAKIARVKTLRNKMIKSRLKTHIKKFNEQLESNNIEEAKALFPNLTKLIDKAAAKGTIHKNAAARKKSKLAAKLNKLSGLAQ